MQVEFVECSQFEAQIIVWYMYRIYVQEIKGHSKKYNISDFAAQIQEPRI